MDEFEVILQSAVYELKNKMEICDHSLDKDEAKELVEMEKRLENYDNKDKQKYIRARLGFACQLIQRRPSTASPIVSS